MSFSFVRLSLGNCRFQRSYASVFLRLHKEQQAHLHRGLLVVHQQEQEHHQPAKHHNPSINTQNGEHCDG